MRRFVSLLLSCALLALCFAGCGSSELVTFTWQVDSMPKSLDPQLAGSVCERTAAEHLFRGLVMLDAEGQPAPDCAESWTVSADGLTYTFDLRDDLYFYSYEEETNTIPVTADDFVFGLVRVFLPETGSPYTQQLGGIAGSAAVMAGGDESQLGVSAPDDKTVVIRLSAPDDTFLYKLCCPGAMPCNREFFASTRGSYGLAEEYLLTNGDFQLYNWAAEGVFLRRKDAPAGVANNLRLVLTDPNETVEGLAALDEGIVSGIEYRGEAPEGYAAQTFTDTVWVLLFNSGDSSLANLSVRQGLAQVLGKSLSAGLPGSTYTAAEGLLPPALPLPDGSPAQGNRLTAYGDAQTLYQQGLAQLGVQKLSGITVLLPQDEGAGSLFESANQQLQRELGAFFSLQKLEEEELSSRIAAGDFQLALVPLSPSDSDAAAFLSQIADYSGVTAAALDQLTSTTLSADQRTRLVLEAENQLLNQAAAVPVWFEQRSFLTLAGWSGIIYSPFGPRLSLRSAYYN